MRSKHTHAIVIQSIDGQVIDVLRVVRPVTFTERKSIRIIQIHTDPNFARNGKVVDKYAGADRVELMNRVLRFQSANGIRLPQRLTPKRVSTAEAKEIARAARDRAKAEGRQSGW